MKITTGLGSTVMSRFRRHVLTDRSATLCDGTGNFTAKSISESCIYIPGNGKAIIKVKDAIGKCLIVAGQNRGPIKVFKSKFTEKLIPVLPSDLYATVTYKNGKSRREEFYYGASFLSQSGRFIHAGKMISSIEVTDSKGNKRKIF